MTLRRSRCSAGLEGRVKSAAWIGLAAAFSLSAACAECPRLGIHDVQGPGASSPYEGDCARLRDVIVSAVGPDGFFVQETADNADDDPRSSEGIYVYGEPPRGLAVGDRVSVEGGVLEFHGHTQLKVRGQVRRSGRAPVPDPVALDGGRRGAWEPVESMRVRLDDGLIVAPTDRHGEVRVSADGRRPLRLAARPKAGPLLEMDPDALGGPGGSFAAPRRFEAVGVLAYRHDDYVVWPLELRPGSAPDLPRPVRAGADGELVLAAYNLRRLFDARRDGNEPVSDEATYRRRLAKHGRWLSEVLHCPDVVAVQEVEAPEALEDLARASGCDYRAVHGGDPVDLALGYLVDAGVRVAELPSSLGAGRRLPDGSPLFGRPPLALVLETRAGTLALINVHLRSMRGLGREPRVAAKRRAQADALNDMARDYLERHDGRVLVLGDFNALPFDDGFADVLGRVAGDDRLRPLWRRLPRAERYSYLYRGHAQMLDHALAGEPIAAWVADLAFARGNADAPWDLRDDGETPLRASDHDPLVVFLAPGGTNAEKRE